MVVEKTRIQVTLSKPYVDGMDRLVEEGVFFTYSQTVMAGLRLLFRDHDIPLIQPEAEG